MDKLCTKCNEEKNIEKCFYLSKTKNKIIPICIECRRKAKNEYRKNNTEKIKKSDQEYRKNNREKEIQRKRLGRINDPHRHRGYSKKYRDNNKDKYKESCSKSAKKRIEKMKLENGEEYISYRLRSSFSVAIKTALKENNIIK
jgi:hypothetical protein